MASVDLPELEAPFRKMIRPGPRSGGRGSILITIAGRDSSREPGHAGGALSCRGPRDLLSREIGLDHPQVTNWERMLHPAPQVPVFAVLVEDGLRPARDSARDLAQRHCALEDDLAPVVRLKRVYVWEREYAEPHI